MHGRRSEQQIHLRQHGRPADNGADENQKKMFPATGKIALLRSYQGKDKEKQTDNEYGGNGHTYSSMHYCLTQNLMAQLLKF